MLKIPYLVLFLQYSICIDQYFSGEQRHAELDVLAFDFHIELCS